MSLEILKAEKNKTLDLVEDLVEDNDINIFIEKARDYLSNKFHYNIKTNQIDTNNSNTEIKKQNGNLPFNLFPNEANNNNQSVGKDKQVNWKKLGWYPVVERSVNYVLNKKETILCACCGKLFDETNRGLIRYCYILSPKLIPKLILNNMVSCFVICNICQTTDKKIPPPKNWEEAYILSKILQDTQKKRKIFEIQMNEYINTYLEDKYNTLVETKSSIQNKIKKSENELITLTNLAESLNIKLSKRQEMFDKLKSNFELHVSQFENEEHQIKQILKEKQESIKNSQMELLQSCHNFKSLLTKNIGEIVHSINNDVDVMEDKIKNSSISIVSKVLKETSKNRCTICCAEDSIYVIDPCGHKVFCEDCYDLFKNKSSDCPICRKHISKVIKVYEE